MAKAKTVKVVVRVATASLGKESAAIGVKIDYDNMSQKDAMESLVESRLDVTLCEDDPDQAVMKGVERIKVSGSADVHRLSMGKDDFSFRLSFNDDDVSGDDLQKLTCNAGVLVFQRKGDASKVKDADDPAQQTMG